MNFWEAVLYGAVQGIAEYLPISSSAHLILLPRFIGSHEYGLRFEVFLHLGTLAATLLYFWKDWWGIIKGVCSRKESENSQHQRLLFWLAVGTLPAIGAGAAFHSFIEENLRANWILVCTLSMGGVLLFLVDRKFPSSTALNALGWKKAFWIGCFQTLALMPGMSRSGSTMMGGRFLGLSRGDAARFSFLLSAPITLAAVVFEFRKWELLLEDQSLSWMALGTAGFSSFLFGCLAIGGLLRLLRTQGYFWFMVYRIGLGILILWQLGPR